MSASKTRQATAIRAINNTDLTKPLIIGMPGAPPSHERINEPSDGPDSDKK